MPLKNTFKITADLKKPSSSKEHTVIQNDDIAFVVKIQDDYLDFPLTDVTTVSLANVRPDGVTIVTPGTIAGTNEVTFNLGTNETAISGRVSATVQLYGAFGRVSTITFNYHVIKDPTGISFVPSASEHTLIEKVLNEGSAIIESARLLEQRQTDLEDSVTQQLAEKLLIEVRTSDPVAPTIGQSWLRSDL